MSAYIVKVMIEDTHPPVWRRIILPARITYADLHTILQIAFDWTDSHLHDFSFPNTDYRVVMDEEDMDFGDCVLEKDVLIDDDLKMYKWIRYTYDFGDDWQHKIQFEKEDPSYKERYAQIIKWKGDNFNEDIGGVYGAYWMESDEYNEEDEDDDWRMEPRRLFDPEAANEQLKMVPFPVRRKKKRKRSSWENGFLSEYEKSDIDSMIDELLKKMALSHIEPLQSGEKPKPSAIDKMIENWRTFSEHWAKALEAEGIQAINPENGPKTAKEFIDSIPKEPKEPVYEQLVLPGVELQEDKQQSDNEIRAGKCVIRFVPDDHTIEQNLDLQAEKHIRNFCKYLRLPYKNGSKTTLIQSYCTELRKHPEYIRLALSYDQLECLLSMTGLRDSRYRVMSTDAVEGAILLGLMRCNFRNSSRQKKAELCFAPEATDLLRRAADTDLDAYYQNLDTQDRATRALLQPYGVLEFSKLFALSKEFAGCTLSKKDFERYVYWHLRIQDMVTTFSDQQSKAYAAIPEIDATTVLMVRDDCAKKLPYKEMSQDLYQKWQKGFADVYTDWAAFTEQILSLTDDKVTPETIYFLILHCFEMVQNACNIRDLCSEICKTVHPKGISDYVFLWESAMQVIMGTGLPALKGYSRNEYADLVTDMESPEIASYYLYLSPFPSDDPDYEIRQDTHLYEFDGSAAESVLTALGLAELSGNSASIAETAELFNNKELLFLQTIEELHNQKFAKANMLLTKLISEHKGYTKDLEDLRDSIRTQNKKHSARGKKRKIDEEKTDDNIIQIPVRKEHAKIYPNDPCPCGSGKKYKKCCGRK